MLKVKSFDILHDFEINSLLNKYRLASGAHILISDGKVCIPYEDGEPDNIEQKRITILEMKNSKQRELDLILHSQEVLKLRIEELNIEKQNIEADIVQPKSKEGYDNKKELEGKIKVIENQIVSHKSQILLNNNEISQILANITVFDKRLKELDANDTTEKSV